MAINQSEEFKAHKGKIAEVATQESRLKGAHNSAKNKQLRKTMREVLLGLLDEEVEVNGKKLSRREIINMAQLKRAASGDTRAYIAVRDTVGESPSVKLEGDVGLQKVFITQSDLKEVAEHINSVLGDK